MDEPTASLSHGEAERLFAIIADLAASGVAVLYVSHRLDEILRLCDRVSVFRDGASIACLERQGLTRTALVEAIVGHRATAEAAIRRRAPAGAPVLTVSNLARRPKVNGVSFSLHRGEVLGIGGLVGSGRSELARAVFGVDRLLGGAVRLDGEPIVIASPRDAIARGIYLVPEDRKREGLLLDVSVAGNISLPDLAFHSRALMVDTASETTNAERQKRQLTIRTPKVSTAVGSLSGGNQQKVVLAKWLAMRPRVLIFDEPTRGIDVGSKNEIYQLMRALADAGVAILMISSDMEEVIGVSDRIAVMHEGSISGFLDRGEFSEHNVLQLAVGHSLH